jgi:tetratricopeptide (TPR) repeat protein
LREIFTAAGSEDELDEALTAVTPDDVFWGVRKALERSARRHPLALVVEDIHWAEPTLIDLLEHVVDWARDAPLMLLCLARPEFLDERPEWGQRAALIALEPLSGHESDELIEGLIGPAQLDEPTRTRIREVAEGNPLFVEQLLAMIAEGGDHERVPPTINALLAARLDALPVEERELIERAAVVGLDFEWEALGALSSDRRRPAGPQLSALVRKDLIRPHELLEDTFRFRHILIRDAAYERIPKQLRADLHERFADWLEPRSEEFGEIVAYHLEQAYRALAELGPTGPRAHELAARAAGHLIAAGSQATDGGDGHAAAGLFARAVSMLPIGDSSRLRALPAFGRALWEAGRIDDAESILSEAIEQGREAGARLIVIDASLTRTELRFSTLSERVERVSREEVVRELEQALPELRELGDDAALARALNLGGRLRFWRGDALVASKDFWQSSLMARRAGARAEEVASLQGLLGTLHQGPTPVAEGLKRIAEIRPRVGRNGSLTTTLLGTQGALLVMQGNFARARQLGAEADAVARDYGLGALHARHAGRLEGLIGILEGRPAIAQKPLQLACDDLERIGERGYLASLAPELAEALYLLGRDEEALDVTERWAAPKLTVPEDAHAQASWRLVRGKLLARRGDLLEGERMVRRGLEIAAGTDYLNLKGQAAADLADVLRLAGRSDEAAEATRQAIGFYQEKGNAAAARLLAAEAVVP